MPPASATPSAAVPQALAPFSSRTELKGTDGPIFAVAWAPDGETLASTGFKQVHLWRTGSSTPLRTFRLHTGVVRSVGWSPDGARIASAGDDGVAYVWNTDTLQSIVRIETGPARAIAWSPDGTRLATASASGTLHIWSADGAPLHRARLQTTLSSLQWSPDGNTIVAGGINGMATRWDTRTGTMISKMYVSWPARNDVNGVTWSPLGQLVAMAHGARGNGGLTLWNPNAGTATLALAEAGGWLRGVSWSPDGQWLAVGGEDGQVRVLDVETGAIAVTLPTDSKPIWSVAWSPDGRQLAAGNTGAAGPPVVGGTVTVWQGPVPVLPGQRARARTRALEALLLERRVVTPVASKPQAAAAVLKDGGVYGSVTRIEPPFGNLETSVVLSDLGAAGITPASRFEIRCRDKTFTILLGEHWTDVPAGEWVAYVSSEGDVIVARNGASASELSGCQAGDSVFLMRARTP